MSMQKETDLTLNDKPSSSIRYVARYLSGKTLICAIKGQRIVEIYLRRGFVEIDHAEFNRIKAEGV